MGVWKKVVAKSVTKWELPSLNGRPLRAQFLTKPKNCCAHQRITWRLFLALKFLKKVIPSLGYGQSKFGPKLWHFLLRFYTNPSLFLAFTVFTSIVYFFGHFLSNPPFENPRLRPVGECASWIFSAQRPNSPYPFLDLTWFWPWVCQYIFKYATLIPVNAR